MSRPSDDIRRITSDHSTIPSAARLVWPDAVPALFVRGIWPVDRPAIAIVGSTDPAPIAREWAFRLGQISADRGWVVVSGLARGIDAAAHEGALAGGGISVAVVANGLDSVYPAEHASLAKRMVERGGALISIAPTGEAATRERLLLRNQVTSALSNAVICVQARGRGGSLATMRHAVLQRRIIAACTMPEDAAEAEWAGNALLLGGTPPWRDRAIDWRPALAVNMSDELNTFFAALEALPDPVDGIPPLRETPGEIQPRLLEPRARYSVQEPQSPASKRDHSAGGG